MITDSRRPANPQRLAGRLPGQLLGCRLAQPVADERQELLGGLRVAPLRGVQEMGEVAHGADYNRPGHGPQGGGGRLPRTFLFSAVTGLSE